MKYKHLINTSHKLIYFTSFNCPKVKLRNLDHDGQINFDEFSSTLRALCNLDKDSDGIISKEEFYLYLKN